MVVGAARIELLVVGSGSLKQKRGVIRSVVKRLSNRFSVSVAEVEGQDSREHAVLGVAMVGISHPVIERRLEHLTLFLESLHLAELVDCQVDVMTVPRMIAGVENVSDARNFDEAFTLAFGAPPTCREEKLTK